MLFLQSDIFTNGIFTYGNLTYGIFTNGIFTAHPPGSLVSWDSRHPTHSDVSPVYGWSIVYDAGPEFTQYWFNVSCLLGIVNVMKVDIDFRFIFHVWPMVATLGHH